MESVGPGMRGPFSDGQLDSLSSGVVDATGGPLGVVKASVFLVAFIVVFVALVIGIEAFLGAVLGPFVPGWLAMPLFLLSVGIVIIGAFVGVLRFMTWRRRTR